MGLVEESVAAPALPAADAGLTRFAVQIDGLSDFAGFVDREMGQNVEPAVKGIDTDHLGGLHWGVRLGSGLGHWASDVVSVARMGHNNARYRSTRNMQRYVLAAQVMVETIHRLMTTYRTSEELARLDPHAVAIVIASAYQDKPPADQGRDPIG